MNETTVPDTGLPFRVKLLTGGFGALRGSACPGIELLTVQVAGDDEPDVILSKGLLLADAPSPTWMERDGDLLYAVLEDTDEIAAYRIEHDDNGMRLAELSKVGVQGESPTHAVACTDDLGAKHLIVANYADGHVCVHPIAADGAVSGSAQVLTGEGRGPLPAQECPHAHWILPLPDGRVLSTDLGADCVYVHHWSSGRLVRDGAVHLAPGTGPRDMHLLPVSSDAAHGWRVAVVGEWGGTVTLLGSSGHVDDGSCGIAVLQTVALGADPLDQAASLAFVPQTVLRNDAASTAGNPAAGFVYVGLRGSERIVSLAWDGETLQRLAPVDEPGWKGRGIDCGGRRPRHIMPVGRLLLAANETSDNVAAFLLADDGKPREAADLPSGSPTVFVRL
ncbi:lactonase family protein [Bifidobacterium leontopitheci]|uniref:Carboxy-cis,cis-muconate cyclase n=1 Tax=Bifidobacterium leontopitheci TaxID=2650774 RepID=A0A6I1GHM3_9BIFI|nr:beta-propeller fold lactonase family protein [Bifidobacterium leontopitheci]KAB7791154.1 carboxy-cis,cis-muconate cyclase [Bifidobacterium leontopitheci]